MCPIVSIHIQYIKLFSSECEPVGLGLVFFVFFVCVFFSELLRVAADGNARRSAAMINDAASGTLNSLSQSLVPVQCCVFACDNSVVAGRERRSSVADEQIDR